MPSSKLKTGVKVEEVCRKVGIPGATFCIWKKKYSAMGAGDLRKLRQLEEENQHLKQLEADLSMDKQLLQDVLKKSSKAYQKNKQAKEYGKTVVGF